MIKVALIVPTLHHDKTREYIRNILNEQWTADGEIEIRDVIVEDKLIDGLEYGVNGFTKSVNSGIKSADWNPDYYWILNDDATPDKFYLDRCLKAFEEDKSKQLGIVHGIVLDSKDSNFGIWCGSAQCYPNGLHISGYLSQNLQLVKPSLQKWLTFVAPVIKKECLQDVGLLDESMRMVYSDSDYSFRARAKGWKLLYWPDAKVSHECGVATNPTIERSSQLIKVFFRDRVAFENKWINGKLFYDLDREVL